MIQPVKKIEPIFQQKNRQNREEEYGDIKRRKNKKNIKPEKFNSPKFKIDIII